MNGPTNWVYEWDWADRLVKVTSNGVVVLQCWYDSQIRRIAKQELVNGQTIKTLYPALREWDIVAVMNASGQLMESYTRGVGLAGDIGTLVAVTHHVGPNAGTYYTHHNSDKSRAGHRWDIELVRQGTTTVASYEYSAFGVLENRSGTDLCRFKISSKERDPSTVPHYAGYYAPAWQRWISHDKIDGNGELHHFVFVGNSPIEAVDPFGLSLKKILPHYNKCCNYSGGTEWALVNGRWMKLPPGQCAGGCHRTIATG